MSTIKERAPKTESRKPIFKDFVLTFLISQLNIVGAPVFLTTLDNGNFYRLCSQR
jgi:hypothetical protein